MDEDRARGRSMSLRCVRAVGVSSLAWAVTSSAHVLAGGAVPGPVEVLCLVLFTSWPLVAVLGGTPSRARMVLVLVVAQGVMHALLELLSAYMPGSSTDPAFVAGGHHGHTSIAAEHAAAASARAAQAAQAVPGTAGHGVDLLPSPMMIGVHIVAAVLLGLALVHGEGLLRSAMRLLAAVMLPIAIRARTVLTAVRATAASAREPGRVRPARVAWVLPDRHVLDVVARGVVRRGPPASL